MRTFRVLSALLLALALAAPAAAYGQSAGDEQYTDPFQGETGGGGGQQGGGQPPPQPQEPEAPAPAPAPIPETDFTDPSVGSTESAQPSSVAPTPTNALPATGLPAVLAGALGAALLLGGAALRRGVR